jgi:hypothetical protein
LDSTARSHFSWPSDKPQAIATRHGSNLSHKHVASGIVPGLKDYSPGGHILCEYISFDHQYSSRENPSQPLRGQVSLHNC